MTPQELDEAIKALPPWPRPNDRISHECCRKKDAAQTRLALVLKVVREYTEAWDQDLIDDDLWEKSAEKRANLRTILQLERV